MYVRVSAQSKALITTAGPTTPNKKQTSLRKREGEMERKNREKGEGQDIIL